MHFSFYYKPYITLIVKKTCQLLSLTFSQQSDTSLWKSDRTCSPVMLAPSKLAWPACYFHPHRQRWCSGASVSSADSMGTRRYSLTSRCPRTCSSGHLCHTALWKRQIVIKNRIEQFADLSRLPFLDETSKTTPAIDR